LVLVINGMTLDICGTESGGVHVAVVDCHEEDPGCADPDCGHHVQDLVLGWVAGRIVIRTVS